MCVGHLLRIVLLACAVCAALLSQATIADDAHVVFMIGEREYKTGKSCRAFYDQHLKPRGFKATFILAANGGEARNDFKGLEAALKDADLLWVSVRRRAPKKEQLQALREYLDKGKPLIAIRTSSHAFDIKRKPPAGHATWEKFDPEVLGGNYHGHYGGGTYRIELAKGAASHPILSGVALSQGEKLYKSGPLKSSAHALLYGKLKDRDPEPVAWTHTYGTNKKARIFYTSMGTVKNFEDPGFQRMLINALYWSLDRRAPKELDEASTSKPKTKQ